MKLFVKTRKSLTKYSLRKKKALSVRNRQIHNFDTAKSVGIFFDTNDSKSFQDIRNFSKKLKARGIRYELLGYVDSDEIPGELLLWDDCNVISNKDIDWIYRPKDSITEGFISKEFDILFDLSLNNHISSFYIVSLSKAFFKVGKFSENENDLDFMISIDQNNSVHYLIEQIEIYVSMINKLEK